MGNPTVFPKLRGSTIPESAARTQDNTDIVLRPVAQALSKTPIMGVAPTWTALEINAAFFVNVGNGLAVAAYYKDAFMRVWVKGYLSAPAGAAGGSLLATMPAGYRPSETHVFAVAGNGAYQSIALSLTGDLTIGIGMAAGEAIRPEFSFLAEQ